MATVGLSTCSPVSGTIGELLGGLVLLEEVHHWGQPLKWQKTQAISMCSAPPTCGWDGSSPWPYQPEATSSVHLQKLSGVVSPIKLFFL